MKLQEVFCRNDAQDADPAVIEIVRGGRLGSKHVVRRSEMRKFACIAGGAAAICCALHALNQYLYHKRLTEKALQKQLAPMHAQIDALMHDNMTLRQELAALQAGTAPEQPAPDAQTPEA